MRLAIGHGSGINGLGQVLTTPARILTTRLKGAVAMSEQSIIPPVIYKSIPGFIGYRVGDDGSIWTCRRKGGNDRSAGKIGPWRLLRLHLTKGYFRVNLDRNGVTHSRCVHRLVLEAFVGPRPSGMEARHWPDQNKTNCRLENLSWDTHDENMKDRYRNNPLVVEKECHRCHFVKPRCEFYRDKRASDGLQTECRECYFNRRKEKKGVGK